MGKLVKNRNYDFPIQADNVSLQRVKYFEDADPVLLQDAVNNFLTVVLTATIEPQFFIDDITRREIDRVKSGLGTKH